MLLLLVSIGCDGGGVSSPRATTGYVPEVDASVEIEPETRPDGQFIATRDTFRGYLEWQSFYLGDAMPDGGVHLSGPRHVYINKMPPEGSTKFPVGTIIVKVIKAGPTPPDWQVFAMVKRGGDYNLFGAVDWEWFELKHTDEDRFAIKWNGVKAPAGEGYGGLGGGACNNCHSNAYANDYVHSPPLTLR